MFEQMVLPVLVFLAVYLGFNILGARVAMMVPALRETLAKNAEADELKMAQPKYQKTVKLSKQVGLANSLFFLLVVAPFVLTLGAQPWWRYLVDIVALLMTYDFFYYLVHRFLFHGDGYFRRVHALHHQARVPTNIDNYYVHWMENLVGLGLFQFTIVLYAVAVPPFGGVHAVSAALAATLYLALNTVNHIAFDLPYTPFKTLNWHTWKHKIHHENMHKGNYASINLLYDKLFGTLD